MYHFIGQNIKRHWFSLGKDNLRRGLMELPHIALRRVEFLQKCMENIKSTSPLEFVYLDETWVFENGSVGRSWQDVSRKSVK